MVDKARKSKRPLRVILELNEGTEIYEMVMEMSEYYGWTPQNLMRHFVRLAYVTMSRHQLVGGDK